MQQTTQLTICGTDLEYDNCRVVLCSVMQQGVTSVDLWISITVCAV